MAQALPSESVANLPAVAGVLRYPSSWRFGNGMVPPDSPGVAEETFAWMCKFGLMQRDERRHHAMAVPNYGGASLPGADRITRTLYTQIITVWLSWDDVCVEGQTPERYKGQETAALLHHHLAEVRAAWQIPSHPVVAPDKPPQNLGELYHTYALAWKDVMYHYYHLLQSRQLPSLSSFWERFTDGLHKWLDTAVEERKIFNILKRSSNRKNTILHLLPEYRAGNCTALTAGPIWHVTPFQLKWESRQNDVFSAFDMQRTITIGMYSTPQIVEASRSLILTDSDWKIPAHQEILRLCGMLVGWPNELFGLGKDFGKGDDWGNLVSIRTTMSGDWKKNFQDMVNEHNAAVQQFDMLATTLPHHFQEYLQHLRYCCSGFTWWHSTAPRYQRTCLVANGQVLRPSVEFY